MRSKREMEMAGYVHLKNKMRYRVLEVSKSIRSTIEDYCDLGEYEEIHGDKFTYKNLVKDIYKIIRSYWEKEVLFFDHGPKRCEVLNYFLNCPVKVNR